MGLKQTLRKWIRDRGYDVIRYIPGEHPLARRDPNWEVFNLALGECNQSATLNIAHNS